MSDKNELTTPVSQWQNEITSLVGRDYSENGLTLNESEIKCAKNSVDAIYHLVKDSGLSMSDIDLSNLRSIVGQCASLQLDPLSPNRECYFSMRKKKIGDDYKQVVEMQIFGDGYDSLLRHFGSNVKVVGDVWYVCDGDDFEYPSKRGFKTEPPYHKAKGLSNKCVRVVYPILLNDDTETYLISERDSVKTNLFAHVRNNLMNETFGICQSRYKATEEQKKQIDEKKEVIYDALRKCETVDDMIACEIARPYMSGAWVDTPEEMIRRKMRNNATKKFPKDLHSMASHSLLEIDETYKSTQEEIEQNANTEPFIDADPNILESVAVEVVDNESNS